MTRKTQVSVIGLGYVGLPLALLAAKKGYKVAGVDLNKEKIDTINQGKDPIGDEYVSDNIRTAKIKASTLFDSVADSNLVLVCVPTPVKSGIEPDLRPLKSAVTSLARYLKSGAMVIVESTVNPGVCDEIVIPAIQTASGLKVNDDFYVAHCPERINPGDKKWNVENIPRVLGASHNKGLKAALEFYKSIIDAPIKPMGTLKEAEAVKIVENSFRDVNIAFVNELALSFSKLGININNVIDGAATKPFAFMPHYPSIGVGGHCIPVDPYYLIEYARGYGFEHEFLSLARTINNRMPKFAVEQLAEGLSEIGLSLKGAKVTILGIAYKANVADDRESPSYKVMNILKARGAKVSTYDPYLPDKSTAKSLRDAIKDSVGIILATNHKLFNDLDPKKMTAKVFVDGKNAFSKSEIESAGIIYKGIGT